MDKAIWHSGIPESTGYYFVRRPGSENPVLPAYIKVSESSHKAIILNGPLFTASIHTPIEDIEWCPMPAIT